MAVTLNASTSAGLVQSADLSGSLNVQSNGTTVLGVTSTGASVTGTQSVSGNLSFNSGYGSSAVAYGCRVWINYNASSTPAIRGSGNVTSITDIGTGEQTVNFTNALPDTNYAVVSLNRSPGLTSGDATQVDIYTTSSVTLIFLDRGGNLYDPTVVALVVFR
jgi:hypothetical protein